MGPYSGQWVCICPVSPMGTDEPVAYRDSPPESGRRELLTRVAQSIRN